MLAFLMAFLRNERGATAIEYGLIASLIAVWIASRKRAINSGVRASHPTGPMSNTAPRLTPSSNKKVRLSGSYSTHGSKSVKEAGLS